MLHHERVRASSGTPSASFVFLHGILGSGSNLRSLARRYVEACPSWEVVLVDLRGHGRSEHGLAPHDLVACADDVTRVAESLALPMRAILGHSFGGKVAMTVTARHDALAHAVLVDAMPGARPAGRGSEHTLRVLGLLEALPPTFATRDAFVDGLAASGLERTTATWLAMSLVRRGDALVLSYDLAQIRTLLDDYFAADLWPLFERPSAAARHVVIGARSEVFGPADRARMEACAASDARVTVDVLPAGHWVHVDDPEGLLRVLTTRVPDLSHEGPEVNR